MYDALFTQYGQQLTNCQYIKLKLAYSWNYLKSYDLPTFKAILSNISFNKVNNCDEGIWGMYYYSQGHLYYILGEINFDGEDMRYRYIRK